MEHFGPSGNSQVFWTGIFLEIPGSPRPFIAHTLYRYITHLSAMVDSRWRQTLWPCSPGKVESISSPFSLSWPCESLRSKECSQVVLNHFQGIRMPETPLLEPTVTVWDAQATSRGHWEETKAGRLLTESTDMPCPDDHRLSQHNSQQKQHPQEPSQPKEHSVTVSGTYQGSLFCSNR